MLLELADMASKLESLENKVLDIYTLKKGIYYRFDAEGKFKDYLIVNKDTPTNSELYLWFKIRDYYSCILETNKYIVNRQIHSNNMYTIFIKCQNLPGVGDNKKYSYNDLYETIDDYYDILAKEKEYDKYEKSLLEEAGIDEIDNGNLNHFKGIMPEVIKNSIENIKELSAEKNIKLKKDDYVKVFIQSDKDENIDINNYIRESNRYIVRKIFNKNKYNKEVDDKIHGLSNENIVLNDKKPYLELKSTKFKVPYRVTLDKAIFNHIIMQWIENAKDENGRLITKFNLSWDYNFNTKPNVDMEQGIYFETRLKNGKAEIIESNVIPKNIEKLKERFKYINYLDIKNDTITGCIERLKLEEYINKIFFKNQIQFVYYNNEYRPKGLNTYCTNALYIMRLPMKNYFRLGVENSLNSIIDKITLGIIINSINDNNFSKYDMANKENLRLNLLRYFKIGGKENMGDILTNVIDKVKIKLNGDTYTPIESDEEYYFCVGQMTYYLCSLSEAKNKTQNMYNSILKAKSAERIKYILKNMYIKYNYKIGTNHKKFDNLMSMIKGYTPNSKNNADMVICGLTVNNLLYDKNN